MRSQNKVRNNFDFSLASCVGNCLYCVMDSLHIIPYYSILPLWRVAFVPPWCDNGSILAPQGIRFIGLP
jgi:hypothetical protein